MLSLRRVMVEELPPVQDLVVRVRYSHQPQPITIVPAVPQLTWTLADEWITVHLPGMDFHSVIAVELASHQEPSPTRIMTFSASVGCSSANAIASGTCSSGKRCVIS
jgi:hypothetical protein